MIDIRKLKELVRLMVTNDLTELDLRDSQEQVTLRRNAPQPIVQTVAVPMAQATMPMAAVAHGGAVATAPARNDAPAAPVDPDAGLVAIESPMVGTFYAAAAPDKPPFVSVGTSVGPETVVCLIEAMKVFNEIKAECRGEIVEVLVNDGDAVEYGQPLFRVKPA